MNQQAPDLQQRIEIVNTIIAEIAKRGRQFFKAEQGKKDGHFLLKGEKLYWWEECRNKPMRLIDRNRHLCHHGGTLWAQLHMFKSYIETGVPSLIISQYWAYPEDDVQAIHQLANKLGYLYHVPPREEAGA